MSSTTSLAYTPVRVGSRPAWSPWGGGALLAGALVLLAATITEYFVWQTTTLGTGVFVVFSALFLVSIVLYVVAMLALAFAGGGIVGSSVIGKVALVAFAIGWAGQQLLYWTSYFFDQYPATLDVLSLFFVVLTYLGAIIAGIVIAIGRVVTGIARWALLVGLVLAGICGTIANASTDATVVTVLLSISCVIQAAIGASYLRPSLREA
ncbi:MAG: hypothetical protein QM626_11005 [Microbacterium sp.]|uniref:hypothetical protein n=1 Tax=Microbacterium sp. TaxID=51671 RepID=UPI0039E34AF1